MNAHDARNAFDAAYAIFLDASYVECDDAYDVAYATYLETLDAILFDVAYDDAHAIYVDDAHAIDDDQH